MKKIFVLLVSVLALSLATLSVSSCQKVSDGDLVTYDLVRSGTFTDDQATAIEIVRVAMKANIVATLGLGNLGNYTYSPDLDKKAENACESVYSKSMDVNPGTTTVYLDLVRTNLSDNNRVTKLKSFKFAPAEEK